MKDIAHSAKEAENEHELAISLQRNTHLLLEATFGKDFICARGKARKRKLFWLAISVLHPVYRKPSERSIIPDIILAKPLFR